MQVYASLDALAAAAPALEALPVPVVLDHFAMIPAGTALADPRAADWTFVRGQGCNKCNHTGYRGRTGIFEFLEVTDPIREMILDGTGTVALRQKAIEQGMETLLVNGLQKVKRGITTMDEVLGAAPLAEGG